MHFAFYLGDSGRIGLNLHFKSDVKSDLSVFVTFFYINLFLSRFYSPYAALRISFARPHTGRSDGLKICYTKSPNNRESEFFALV